MTGSNPYLNAKFGNFVTFSFLLKSIKNDEVKAYSSLVKVTGRIEKFIRLQVDEI